MRFSLSKLSFFNSLFTILVISIALSIMAGYEYNAFYEKKKEELKQEYIEKNKRLLQEEVAMEVKRINNIISDFYFSVFSILDNRVHMIESLIHSQIKTHQYLKNKQLNKHIFDTINSLNYSNADNYDFIFNEQGEILFHSLEKRLEGLNILESSEFAPELKNSVKKVIKDGEASAGYVFVRNGVKRKIYTDMKKVNDFFIASCIYIDNLEEELQKNIFKSLEYSRLGVDRKGYFWVTNSENIMLFHPFQKELISKNLTELKTKRGVAIFKEVDKLLQDKDEAFLTYDWQVPDTDEYAEKIAYVKKIPKWDWVLGSGFYLKDLDEFLQNEEKKQKEFLDTLILKILLIVSVLFAIVLSISWYISQRFEEEEGRQKRHLKLLEQYKQILDLSAIVTKTDLSGRIKEVNSLFEQVSGYKKEEVIGKAHRIVRHPSTPKETFEDMWRVIQSGNVWRGVLKNLSKNKKRSYINKTIIFPIKDEFDTTIEYISTSIDITEIIEQRDTLQNLFLTDALTGLASRIKLLNEINKSQTSGFLALIDIARFTEVNDMFGNQKGDDILKQVAKRLFEFANQRVDGVFRMYADVFALYSKKGSKEEFESLVRELLAQLSLSAYKVLKSEINLNFTAGMAYGDVELMAYADMALKIAKKTNKDLIVYDKNISIAKQFEENHIWMKKLSHAIRDERIVPFFQPIYNLRSKKIEKYEVLMRYIEEDGKEVSPYSFIEIAKKTRIYPSLTMSVVEQAVSYFKDKTAYSFSINLTLEDLLNKESMDYIYTTLKQHNLFANTIFEIVESEELESFEDVEKTLKRFKQKGVQIAIDDFGSGYSNYSYLLKLDVDFIKIDGSIIKDLLTKASAKDLVSSVVQFAQKSGIKTVAEFVSSQEISKIVQELGVDYAQGYYYGKPEKQI